MLLLFYIVEHAFKMSGKYWKSVITKYAWLCLFIKILRFSFQAAGLSKYI